MGRTIWWELPQHYRATAQPNVGGPRASKMPVIGTLCGHLCGQGLQASPPTTCKVLKEVVGSARFERATCRLGGGCSIQLSYEPTCQRFSKGQGPVQDLAWWLPRLILPQPEAGNRRRGIRGDPQNQVLWPAGIAG